MKLYEPTFMICMILLVGALIVGIASNKVAHMGDDNIVEELAEDVIKEESGMDVDLSPESPEKKEYHA